MQIFKWEEIEVVFIRLLVDHDFVAGSHRTLFQIDTLLHCKLELARALAQQTNCSVLVDTDNLSDLETRILGKFRKIFSPLSCNADCPVQYGTPRRW